MKRIMDGVTYDTETAAEVFTKEARHPSMAWWGIYQTRHGAFFKVVVDHDGETTEFAPLSDREAQKLVEKHANQLVEEFFGPMPEYGAAEKRLTLRLPISLAARVERIAAERDQPINRFIMRCLEKCLANESATSR